MKKIMMNYILDITLCWAILYGFYALFLSRTTFYKSNRRYLLGTIIFGLIIPFIELPIPLIDPGTTAALIYLPSFTIGVENLEVAGSASASNRGINMNLILLLLYGTGVLAFTARSIAGLWKVRRLYQQGIKEKHEHFTLIRTQQPHLPFSFFSCLFWSEDVRLDQEFSEIVLKHENAHISGWHSLDVLFLEFLCVLFWFNPLIHLYRVAIRDTHEYLADQAVLETTRRKKYGHLLLSQSQAGLQVALANHFIQSQLKNRIIMMTKIPSSKFAIGRYFLAVPVLLLLTLSFSSPQLIEETPPEIVKQTAKDTIPGDEIFRIVEQMPRFPGCEDMAGSEQDKKACANQKMLEFLQNNIQYPADAKEKGVEGTVIVQFVVDKNGAIQNTKILRDIGAGCGEEALRVLHLMNEQNLRWTPGKQRGQALNLQLTLPISFKVPGKD